MVSSAGKKLNSDSKLVDTDTTYDINSKDFLKAYQMKKVKKETLSLNTNRIWPGMNHTN